MKKTHFHLQAVAYARNIKLGRPIFIPSLQIGTYGTVTPLNSFPKTRSDFFDVMAAGPAVGTYGSPQPLRIRTSFPAICELSRT